MRGFCFTLRFVLAVCPLVVVGALADEAIELVNAGPAVQTGIRLALVRLRLAHGS